MGVCCFGQLFFQVSNLLKVGNPFRIVNTIEDCFTTETASPLQRTSHMKHPACGSQ